MTLETFQTLYIVFLVLTIVFLILSIVFFFVFDIRKIFSIKTGRAVRKSVQELNEINRSEDNRKRKKYKGHSMQLSKELTGDFDKVTGEMTGGMNRTGDITDDSVITEQLGNIGNIFVEEEGTDVLVAPTDMTPATELLTTANNKMPETEVLVAPKNTAPETEVLVAPKNTAPETEVLVAPKNTAPETEVLIAPTNQIGEVRVAVAQAQEQANVAIGMFNIIERKEVTFADEIR
ncbi:MAG: hypothetical protein E7264_11100 [Lachnospiraceae bacterium]|nr:hypothetical protein [Lachnospiraceae bacterium]